MKKSAELVVSVKISHIIALADVASLKTTLRQIMHPKRNL